MTILDDPLLSTVYLQHLSNNLLEHLVIVFFNVSRILVFNVWLKSNILETLKKQSAGEVAAAAVALPASDIPWGPLKIDCTT